MPEKCHDRWLKLHSRRRGLSLEVFMVVKDSLFIAYDVASQADRCPAFWDQKFFKVLNKW